MQRVPRISDIGIEAIRRNIVGLHDRSFMVATSRREHDEVRFWATVGYDNTQIYWTTDYYEYEDKANSTQANDGAEHNTSTEHH